MGMGWFNLHGNSHGRRKSLSRQFDVGVDVRNFRSVRLAEIIARAKTAHLGKRLSTSASDAATG
jgi:calcineurin-like phosphoesterase family protein